MDDPPDYFQEFNQQPDSIFQFNSQPNNMLNPIPPTYTYTYNPTSTFTSASTSPCLLTPAQRILPHPSVLDPVTRAVIPFTYEEATSALHDMYFAKIQAYGLLERRTIDVVIYDTKGGTPSCHKAEITPRLDLQTLIKVLQAKVDRRQSEPAHQDKGRLLVKKVEIRCGTTAMDVLFPSLKGEVMDTKLLGVSAEWVSWECNGGPLDNYWRHYRSFMLSRSSIVTPILKVQTTSCRADDPMEGGHIFKGPTIEYHRARRNSSGKMPHRISVEQKPADNGAFKPGEDVVDEQPVEDDDLSVESDDDSKEKTKSWSYYQKLGGDPEMHKLHNFDHVYFVPKPEVEHRDYVEGETLVFDEQAMVGDLIHEVKEELNTEKVSEEEIARITRYRTEFEAARSFDLDDDKVYFPAASKKGKLPEARLMLAKKKTAFIPVRYANVPLLREPKPNKTNFAASYYQARTTQPTGVSSTVSTEDQHPQRYGSPRNAPSKTISVAAAKARPFTPGTMAFHPMNTGFGPSSSSRAGSPALKYSAQPGSFHMPSANNQFVGSNTTSRSRPISPLRFPQTTLFGMSTLGTNQGHHNQPFISSMRANGDVATSGLALQNFADWQAAGTSEGYVFDSKYEFGSNGSGS
jgi:hypothetical protein